MSGRGESRPGAPAGDVSAAADLAQIFAAALDAADPARALARALDAGGLPGLEALARLHVFALGKAAPAMARAALARLGARAVGGAVVAPRGLGTPLPPLDVFEASHPLPDASSLAAGEALLQKARGLGPGEGALVLVSGGASSLAEAPAPGLTLDDLRRANELFLQSGLAIDKINAMRCALSAFKGGRLGEAFGAAPFATFVLSDVVRGGPALVGSGPTLPAAPGGEHPGAIARRAGLSSALPPAVRDLLEAPRPPPSIALRPFAVVADVGVAARAAARAAEALGYTSTIMSLSLEGEAREAGAAVARAALARRAPGARHCLVWGGETTVRVRGRGRGGRNQELALAAALALEGEGGVAILAAATDGVDGPTDAAGGLVDGSTAARARAAGVDPAARLDDNDAHAALAAAGALVRTGPTGTNVNDLTIALVGARG
jgi:glycerate 2-kinase